MILLFDKSRLLVSCIVFSVLVHFLFFYAARMFGTYDFTGPFHQSPGVMVDLAVPGDMVSPVAVAEKQGSGQTNHEWEDEKVVHSPIPYMKEDSATPSAHPEQRLAEPAATGAPAVDTEGADSAAQSLQATSDDSPDELHQPSMVNTSIQTPLTSAGVFPVTKNEKLSYVISLMGLPVGNAELEAENRKGELWISLRVRSNAAISSIFPVDNSVVTRHVGGNFIITKISQQEGSFRSKTGFTIFQREKSIFWIDLIKNRSLRETIPSSKALDTLSAFYDLRNRNLQIGKSETLHIYDSETYADVPVEILRREVLRLPNLKNVDTLVVRPLQQTGGIFRRTGEILIWLTDDAHKVPVKIVTSIALGKVTAELVSAESTPAEEVRKGK